VALELGIDPPLPPQRIKAHLALRYSSASRIIVQYSNAAGLREALGSGIFTNSMPASLHDQSMHLPGSAIVLSGIAGGDDEPTLQNESQVLARVDKVVQIAAARRVRRIFGCIHSWTRDPWSRSVVRAPIGDQRRTIVPLLAAPLGNRLFFAGEHTDDRPGSGGMEGAAKSALRAAREVINSAGLS
jgi:monoamine oxidase